ILDDDDEFHLFWRIDDFNLEDGGKLLLEDGSTIRGNGLEAGGTGRLKLNLCDWDGDGRVDMIVGTTRNGSVPNLERGLPRTLGLPGAAILFLKNVGTNREPVFRFPELISHEGKPLFFGIHSCGPAPAALKDGCGLDLIAGKENGRFYYYSRENLLPV
ncbi:MAG: VCBS repeat-containing protein, partial [Spirochaetales bacterium]|nr:VCBS repeat-containing protein [Spirochaetales bacterium]